MSLRWSLASQQIWAMVISIAPSTDFQGRFAALWRLLLAWCLLFCGLAGIFSSSRYITGTFLIAIPVPFLGSCVFNGLQHSLP